MRLVLQSSVFTDANKVALSGLLHRAVEKRCYVEVADPSHQMHTNWLNSQDRSIRYTWQTLLDWTTRDKSAFRSSAIIVDDDGGADWDASPPTSNLRDAIKVIDAPFHILLENGRFDSAFLLSMATPPQRAFIESLVQGHRVIFDGGGGIGDLRKKVEDQVSAHPYRSVRYWALFDSDAPAPGIRSTEATLAANACVKSGIKHHVLDRRAIENYLPKGALYDWVSETRRKAAERRKKADAFYRLSPDQRAHFHVKSGFTKPPCEHERSLFKEVSELDRATLASGVGKKVAELYGTMDPRRLRSFVEKEGSDKELRPAIAELIEMLRVPNG